jgi:hypothetical protein
MAGDGSSWEAGPDFQPLPGRWQYLAVVVEPGELRSRGDDGDGLSPAEEAEEAGFRPLKGPIREARIMGRALPAAEISQQYEWIRGRLR